jgi:hypothetical protein
MIEGRWSKLDAMIVEDSEVRSKLNECDVVKEKRQRSSRTTIEREGVEMEACGDLWQAGGD